MLVMKSGGHIETKPQGARTKVEIVNNNRGWGGMSKMVAGAGSGKKKQKKEKIVNFIKKGRELPQPQRKMIWGRAGKSST